MKKEISPAVILGVVVGLVAVISVVVFLLFKSDPATHGPYPAPRIDAQAMEREDKGMASDRDPSKRVPH